MNPINPTNPINQDHAKYFLITIDVEDWFQVENFKQWIPFTSWKQCELRVERNVHSLLDLFDSVKRPSPYLPAERGRLHFRTSPTVRATFFTLGWIAERLPHLVREIQFRGHEIASHTYNHNRCDYQTSLELTAELTKSKNQLEDIIGREIMGFRSPSFSVNREVLKTIERCGYRYDSSYNSFSVHGRYGKISLDGYTQVGIALKISNNFFELPVSNLTIGGHLLHQLTDQVSSRRTRNNTSPKSVVLPWGGGGYFRLIPFLLFKIGVKTILKSDNAYLFYIHPWEIDPNQPKVKISSAIYKFRHYSNISNTKDKLIKFLNAFSAYRFITCNDYISKLS